MSSDTNGTQPPDFSLAHPVLSPSNTRNETDPPAEAQDRRPHILLLLDGFPKSLGGGERIALRLAEWLPAYGFRVSILTFAIHPESVVRSFDIPCPIYLLPLQRTYDLKALQAARSLGRFLSKQNIRLVQTFFESSDLWGGVVVRLLSSARLVWSRRDMGILRESKHQVAYRLLASMPHRVFAVSEQVRRHVIDVDGVDASKVQVVYNGLDLADFTLAASTRSQPGTEELRVVTVGNIRRVKGHDLLLHAATAVLKEYPNVSFWIAGEVLDEAYFASLQHQIVQAGISHRVHFVHNVRSTAEFLGAAALFVLPSRSEGFSNAILEAMAAGLPVVATDVGGNAEAVEDGTTGLIVPPEDAPALASAIVRILRDAVSMRAMGEAGKMRVAELFTTQAMLETVTEAYRELLQEG